MVQGHSIFPKAVVAPADSPRLLVSGMNNPKLGKLVAVGDRIGWPIYHLTLEERATCPRSCDQWRNCYGNAMHRARRHDVDGDFLFLLKAEVCTVARQHPDGLLIRLHTLGDFYSVEYVQTWAKLLLAWPQLHVFGYTARTLDDEDQVSREIAQAIDVLTRNQWQRFAVRTSASRPLEQATPRATVIEHGDDPGDAIICPAQLGRTESCATCGLCWNSTTKGRTIAFLRHGMKRRGPGARGGASR